MAETEEEMKENIRKAVNNMLDVIGYKELIRVAEWVKNNPSMARTLLKNYLK